MSREAPGGTSGDPVRVVRIIARLNVGGPARHVVLLSAGTQARYPTLLVAGSVQRGEADMSGFARERGVAFLRIPELGRTLHPLNDVVAFWKLWRLCRAARPYIVHTHTAKAGTLGRLAAWLAGVPVRVHTFHGHVFHGYFGRLKTLFFITVERALARITTKFVAISPRQAKDVARHLRLPPDRVGVIPLGLDLDRFLTADAEQERQRFRQEIGVGEDVVVTMVGRLTAIKNHELAIRAFSRLRHASPRFLLALVGGGEEEERLRELASRLGLAERVRFLGWRRDLEAVYYGSDVIAVTSDNEGTPVCLIEALACGRAVVATNVGGVADVLEEGRLGLLIPPQDEAAFVQALEALAQPVRRRELADRARRAITERYGIRRLLSDMEGLYDQLLAQRSGHS